VGLKYDSLHFHNVRTSGRSSLPPGGDRACEAGRGKRLLALPLQTMRERSFLPMMADGWEKRVPVMLG